MKATSIAHHLLKSTELEEAQADTMALEACSCIMINSRTGRSSDQAYPDAE